jgi:hypothetical protein
MAKKPAPAIDDTIVLDINGSQQRLRLCAARPGRAVLLTDFGSIERGRTFNALLRETLVAMVRTYGVSAASERCET